ncbi:MAG: hypothetical protein M1814_003678 [Vezdaea aestivalis]|nr:MAG: hypothetical protein M1814_003678 [Vezdaea aestivalis]
MRRLQAVRSWRVRPSPRHPLRAPLSASLSSTTRSQWGLSATSPEEPSERLEEQSQPLPFTKPPPEFPKPYPTDKSTRLAALHARLLLPSKFPLLTLSRCLLHSTANSYTGHNNVALAVLGSDLLAYWTSESIICRFPRLPVAVIQAAMSAYIGDNALGVLCKEWGVEHAAEPGQEVDAGLLQFKSVAPGAGAPLPDGAVAVRPMAYNIGYRQGVSSSIVYDDEFGNPVRIASKRLMNRNRRQGDPSYEAPTTTLSDAQATFARAVFGALYLHTGQSSCRSFFRAHILSRQLDMKQLFGFEHPSRELSRLCDREGFESPVARLVAETGRMSRHPAYVAAIYSGKDKLGEGTGASLDEARTRAAANSLKSWYLYQPLEVRVPSDMEDPVGKETPWEPVMIDGGEVVA